MALLLTPEKIPECCICLKDSVNRVIQTSGAAWRKQALGEKVEQLCRLCCKIITGVPEQLAKNPVPFFGDQLTRVRLQGAKSLRIMAPTPEGRFADVGPIVCTLWHAKQDFLEVMCCLFVMVFLFLNFCLS